MSEYAIGTLVGLIIVGIIYLGVFLIARRLTRGTRK